MKMVVANSPKLNNSWVYQEENQNSPLDTEFEHLKTEKSEKIKTHKIHFLR
jgi:hypothetical protein